MKLKGSSKATQKYLVTKHTSAGSNEESIEVITEKPFQVLINDDLLATVMLSPTNLEKFLVGFLIGQGIISDVRQIKKTLIEGEKGLLWAQVKEPTDINLTKSLITSGCSGGFALDNFSNLEPLNKASLPNIDIVGKLMKEMLVGAKVYKESGGVHSACLASLEGDILFQVEDVGRHNCLDKVIGYLVNNELDPKGKIILTTGRISIEAVIKTVRSQVAVLGSRTSPTNLAIDLARKLNLLLLGYIKTGKLIDYTG